jgi:hypothetical protein
VPATPAAADRPKASSAGRDPVKPRELLGPFGLMTGLAGLATFYLSPFIFPFLLSGAGVALGFVGLRSGGDRQIVGALALGSAGLVLEIIALALNA